MYFHRIEYVILWEKLKVKPIQFNPVFFSCFFPLQTPAKLAQREYKEETAALIDAYYKVMSF